MFPSFNSYKKEVFDLLIVSFNRHKQTNEIVKEVL